MNGLVIVLSALLVLGSAGAVPAQSESRGLGQVLGTLGQILGGGTAKLEGTVVLVQGSNLVLRTSDEQTVRIDTAGIDPRVVAGLRPGEAVTVTAQGGSQAAVPSAKSIEPAPRSATARTFRKVQGTVQQESGSQVLFRTADGLVLPVDVSRIRGLPYFSANEPATLIYEEGPSHQIQAVWLEPGAAGPAGGTPPTASVPPASVSPSASVPSATQTLQGLVQSIGLSSLALQTSEGRVVTVDTGGVDRQTLGAVRPGDLVTVTGSAAGADRFVASSLVMNSVR